MVGQRLPPAGAAAQPGGWALPLRRCEPADARLQLLAAGQHQGLPRGAAGAMDLRVSGTHSIYCTLTPKASPQAQAAGASAAVLPAPLFLLPVPPFLIPVPLFYSP